MEEIKKILNIKIMKKLVLITIGAIIINISFAQNLKTNNGKEVETSNYVENVKLFVEDCLSGVIEDGIKFISLQGGYFNVPDNAVKITDYFVPVYFPNDSINIPKIDLFQKELSFYIKQNLKERINNFNSIRISGVKISAGKPDINVVADKDVKVKLIYPVVIEVNGSKTILNEFEASFDFDYNYVYGILEELIEKQEESPNYVIAGTLLLLADENNPSTSTCTTISYKKLHEYQLEYENTLKDPVNNGVEFPFYILYLPDDVVIYSICLNISGFKTPYVFSLGLKFDW